MIREREHLLFECLGEPALAYLLASDRNTIRGRIVEQLPPSLGEDREKTLTCLLEIDERFANVSHESIRTIEWVTLLANVIAPNSTSTGNIFRQMSGGTLLERPEDLSDLEATVWKIASDIYPGMIVRDESSLPGAGLARALFGNPLKEKFETLILEDTELAKLFTDSSGILGRSGYSLRSTGRGSLHQLSTFADLILASGLKISLLETLDPTVSNVVQGALDALNTIRLSLVNGEVSVAARIGMAGVLLPDGCNEIDFGWAKIRKEDERDARHISSTPLSGEVHLSTPEGESISIKFSGDLVIEFELPYEVRLEPGSQRMDWPEDLLNGSRIMEELTQNLRLGLLLACPDIRPVIMPTWRVVMDPLCIGNAMSWFDPSRTPGMRPLQLSEQQGELWVEWAKKIHDNRTVGIGVAIRRMLMAIAERHSPEDVLVDAVIVWENLFGSRTETTFRVSSALAWLLGDSSEDRMRRQKRYKEIYGIRSSVVHGSENLNSNTLQAVSKEAVGIAIAALGSVFGDRRELLKLKDSDARSLHVIHSG